MRTGGDFYFWAHGEFSSAAAAQVMAENIMFPLDAKPVLYVFGEFPLSGEKRKFSFSVPEGAQKLNILAGIQSKDSIAFLKPDGQRLSSQDPGVKIHEFTYMLMAAVKHPPVGQWAVELQGKGKFQASARAYSQITP